MGRAILASVVSLVIAATAQAQDKAWRFHWQTGQVLNYKVEHTTSVAETIDKVKEQTTSKLNLVKQWKVLSVDAGGVATLQLTLIAMRNEQRRPNGETLIFDSANLAKSTPALREHMKKFIGTPIAELRIDAAGQVLSAKQDAQRYEAEPPFQLVLPGAPIAPGQSWERPYTITLNPPHGTGEKYQAVQQFQCKETTGPLVRIGIATTIKNLPAKLDQVPLFAKMTEGEVTFNHATGTLHSAHVRIVRDLQDHQGKGSSYHFESEYREELVGK